MLYGLLCYCQACAPEGRAISTTLQHLLALAGGTNIPHVTHGVDAETPDRATLAHAVSFALEGLLRVIGS